MNSFTTHVVFTEQKKIQLTRAQVARLAEELLSSMYSDKKLQDADAVRLLSTDPVEFNAGDDWVDNRGGWCWTKVQGTETDLSIKRVMGLLEEIR